ncbi:SAV_915 family protein [Streptomyces sp. I05A-00742]|uniref:SAV_915 family protein n=1 Tax=Streptomyces sp. I05A-00742 TaxID=2732853 RepID=UPI002017E6E5|nr:SAV_915 family protein [Streptomyces sp. I05A-00742]
MHVNRTPAEAAAVAAVTAAHSPAADGGESSEEPSHPGGAVPPPVVLYVPVRPCPVGFALRVFRTPLGVRTAVAFTTPGRLAACLGRHQPAVRLALPAVRALAAPLGVTLVSVDPQLTAPAVRPSPDGPAPAPLLPTLPG